MPANVFLQHGDEATADTSRNPSKSLWRNCPILEIIDSGRGIFHHEDWENSPDWADSGASTSIRSGYYPYIDSTCSIRPAATGFGELVLTTGATTADKEVALTTGGNRAVMTVISNTAGSNRHVWFEARIKVSLITDTVSWYVGLAEEGTPADGLLADDGTGIAAKDLVGFEVQETDGDAIDAIHLAGSGASTKLVTGIKVPVAATYIKLGIHFDGTETSYWVDGVKNATTVKPGATNFPNGEELAVLFALKQHSSTSVTMTVDWWRLASIADEVGI